MEIAIALFIGIITGFMMGRQNAQDKVRVEKGEEPRSLFDDSVEIETNPIEEGLNNILNYDGSEQ